MGPLTRKGTVVPMAKGLFPRKAYPACRNCVHGHLSQTGGKILCPRRGIVAPDYSCRKYRYDPLKRVPRRLPALPSFDRKDFIL